MAHFLKRHACAQTAASLRRSGDSTLCGKLRTRVWLETSRIYWELSVCLSRSVWWFFSEAASPRQEVGTPLSSEVQWRPHRGNTGLIVPTLSSHLPPSDSPSALIVDGEMLLGLGQQQHHNQTSEALRTKLQSAGSCFCFRSTFLH